MHPIIQFFDDFLSLLYPKFCLACQEAAPVINDIICPTCYINLPQTEFHIEADNPVLDRFWGRVNIEAATSMYRFTQSGRVQALLHQLKYKQQGRVGIQIGRWYGNKLKDAPLFKSLDCIVPVPVHSKKERERGYNQSALFAQGLSEVMNLPIFEKGLRRVQHSTSQTKKSRADRFQNVMRAFEVYRSVDLKGKHILLVDDVLTTGATLEACALKLLQVHGTKVSLATIALADD